MRRTGIGGLAATGVLGGVLAAASGARAGDLDCAAQRQDELTCLACNIYHEARGEPEQGQLAVAMVTLNRLRTADFPKSICEVVWEKGRDARTGRTVAQFSWTLDDRPDVVTDAAAWDRARGLAARALAARPTSTVPDPSLGALYFHADTVTPDWSGDPALRLLTRIGGHLFYGRSRGTPPSTAVMASLARSLPALPDTAAMDPELLRNPAFQAVRRGAKLISLSGGGSGGMMEARIYEGTRKRVVLLRREGL